MARLENGDLIASAEEAGFEVLVTADKGMRYQQSMADRKISIILLRNFRITIGHLRPLVPNLLEALEDLPEGSFLTVTPQGIT